MRVANNGSLHLGTKSYAITKISKQGNEKRGFIILKVYLIIFVNKERFRWKINKFLVYSLTGMGLKTS